MSSDQNRTVTVPPEAIEAAAEAVSRELMSGKDYSMAADSDEALAKAALEAAAPLIGGQYAAAERDRIRYLITDKRNEFAGHARQAHALPKTAETLALRAETLSEVLGLLGGAP